MLITRTALHMKMKHGSNLVFQVGLTHGNHLDFDQGPLGQVAHSECRTAGEGLLEELGIDLVHGPEVGDVAQQHGGLDHVVQAQPLALEDGLGVEQRLSCLLLDASVGECARGGVNGELSRQEIHGSAGSDVNLYGLFFTQVSGVVKELRSQMELRRHNLWLQGRGVPRNSTPGRLADDKLMCEFEQQEHSS